MRVCANCSQPTPCTCARPLTAMQPVRRAHLHIPRSAVGVGAVEAVVHERDIEPAQAALRFLLRHIEDGHLRSRASICGTIEVAVFGVPFRVERCAVGHEPVSGQWVAECVVGEAESYLVSYGWLTRDEVVGGLCRWCAGTGLNPELSRTKRLLLERWRSEPAPTLPNDARTSTRVVVGVGYDHPFASWLRHPFADAMLAEDCISVAEACCPRCAGWGDERAC